MRQLVATREARWRLALVVIAACAFVHTLVTPMFADDYYHAWGTRPIGITDAPHEAWIVYTHQNGRLWPHILIYAFSALPHLTYVTANAVVTAAFFALGARIATRDGRRSAAALLAFVALFWWGNITYGQTMVWLSGSFNYLWTTALMLCFLVPYFRYLYEPTPARLALTVAMPFLGFFAGAGNENGAPAMIVMAALILALRRRVPLWSLLGLLGAIIGFGTQLFSPGNHRRSGIVASGDGPITEYGNRFAHLCGAFATTPLAQLFGLCLALMAYAWLGGARRRLVPALVMLIGALAAHGALLLAPMFPNRSLMPTTTFLVVAVVMAARAVPAPPELRRVAVALLAGMVAWTVASYGNAVGDSIAASLANSHRITCAKALGPHTDVLAAPLPVYNSHVAGNGLEDWPNYAVAEWLGVGSVKVAETNAELKLLGKAPCTVMPTQG